MEEGDDMKALVSLSGGMDSATVLALAVLNRGKENVRAVGFFYGSKHNPFELECASAVSRYFEVNYVPINVSSIFSSFNSALLDPNRPIPEGHYEEESMKQTIVPNRNMIFLSILAGFAVSECCGEIWLGVHAGDHAIYEDCRPEFIEFARQTIRSATGHDLNVVTPFLYLTKKDILKVGYEYDVPYQHTRTCYSDKGISCGRCGSCVERLTSFHEIEKEDPIDYEDREFYKTFLKKE
jgi:7-cyano-7-deazaguanine synthase